MDHNLLSRGKKIQEEYVNMLVVSKYRIPYLALNGTLQKLEELPNAVYPTKAWNHLRNCHNTPYRVAKLIKCLAAFVIEDE